MMAIQLEVAAIINRSLILERRKFTYASAMDKE